MQPVLLFHYFDNDLWYAILDDESNKAQAIGMAGQFMGDATEAEKAWLESIEMEMIYKFKPHQFPTLPHAAQVVILRGY